MKKRGKRLKVDNVKCKNIPKKICDNSKECLIRKRQNGDKLNSVTVKI